MTYISIIHKIMYLCLNSDSQIFRGNTDAVSLHINAFQKSIVAQYIRFHPLKAESQQGPVHQVNVRITAVTCSEGMLGHLQL